MWQEVESIAEHGFIALAVHASKAAVAPFGGSKPFFGTDPRAFAWPRRDGPPMAFDQATSVRAKGEVLVAARDGEEMEPGVGIGPDGNPTTDPHEILNGALLTFGGYKGASIGLMIELLSSSLIGEWAAYEQKERDNNDGGPPRGGELVVAFDPGRFGNAEGWLDHSEALFEELLNQDGTRLPGDRRLANRKKNADRKYHHSAIALPPNFRTDLKFHGSIKRAREACVVSAATPLQ